VYHGFRPSANCYRYEFGVATWYGHPSDLGCGGYIYNFTQWSSGDASYLYFESYA
jgi:hypothetical protein